MADPDPVQDMSEMPEAKDIPAKENSLTLKRIKHPKKRAFLIAYAMTGNALRASQAAKIGRETHYFWHNRDPNLERRAVYRELFALAKEAAAEYMEGEAWRRAVVGYDEPVYGTDYKDGKPLGKRKVGTVRRYSDTLLIFLLKGARPDKYRERYEHTGPGGGPLAIQPVLPRAMNDADLLREIEQIQKRLSAPGQEPAAPADTPAET